MITRGSDYKVYEWNTCVRLLVPGMKIHPSCSSLLLIGKFWGGSIIFRSKLQKSAFSERRNVLPPLQHVLQALTTTGNWSKVNKTFQKKLAKYLWPLSKQSGVQFFYPGLLHMLICIFFRDSACLLYMKKKCIYSTHLFFEQKVYFLKMYRYIK